MDTTAVLVVTGVVFLWGVVSSRLERADLTAPIVFTVVGIALGWSGLVSAPSAPEQLRPLVEVTLVWVLFSDAARIPVRALRDDAAAYLRLLGIGLPLTVLLGWGLATWMFPALDVWVALVIAAALAPTDAALGVAVVTNPVVPSRIRRLIAVESGLNDGIATPVVLIAVAGAASAEGVANVPGLGDALAELAIGALGGVVIGAGSGWLLRWARRRGWVDESFAGIAVLALAVVAYTGAHALHGNGFVAAFCAGLAFGATAGPRGLAELVFVEETSGLVSLLVWLAFGAIVVPVATDLRLPATWAYAVLSLTVVRMAPVALSLLGARMDRGTVLFVGWFGPRGLASLVFALIALEELGPAADEAIAVIAATVFLSVVAHGVSAAPLAARYGARRAATGGEPAGPDVDVPVRGLPRRRGSRAGSVNEMPEGSGD